MASTQDALYRRIDLDLSWSERDLPERVRTKHVHRLHPYLGKFIPQLVEALLERHVPKGRVLDPFAGSGTTLVQALESGYDACGADVAAFNCLLMRVKTREYEHADVLRVVLARAARSARRTTHFDLDFPRTPQRSPYWCHKHRRECRPVGEARRFLRRYALDTLARVREFARLRARGHEAVVLHGDARELDFGGRFDGVVTSPPYPGLIDYHEQHRYAYELLGLEEWRELELGKGTSR